MCNVDKLYESTLWEGLGINKQLVHDNTEKLITYVSLTWGESLLCDVICETFT